MLQKRPHRKNPAGVEELRRGQQHCFSVRFEADILQILILLSGLEFPTFSVNKTFLQNSVFPSRETTWDNRVFVEHSSSVWLLREDHLSWYTVSPHQCGMTTCPTAWMLYWTPRWVCGSRRAVATPADSLMLFSSKAEADSAVEVGCETAVRTWVEQPVSHHFDIFPGWSWIQDFDVILSEWLKLCFVGGDWSDRRVRLQDVTFPGHPFLWKSCRLVRISLLVFFSFVCVQTFSWLWAVVFQLEAAG